MTFDAIRIVVVDDHPMMRSGIIQALEQAGDFDVVGDGASARDAIELAERYLPNLMLIDINMPGGGLEAVRAITASCPAVACVIITVREDEQTVLEALRLGARGYVLKGIGGQELAQTLRAVHQGEAYITPSLAARLLAAQTGGDGLNRGGADKPGQGREPRLGLLNEREQQILQMIAKGMINKQIGAELNLSEKTVKHYVTNILQKLQVSNRVEAALLAQRTIPAGD